MHFTSFLSSYVYVLLAEGLWVFSHHVGQVPLAHVELVHLFLDEVQRELLRSCSCQVPPPGGAAQTDAPVNHLHTNT